MHRPFGLEQKLPFAADDQSLGDVLILADKGCLHVRQSQAETVQPVGVDRHLDFGLIAAENLDTRDLGYRQQRLLELIIRQFPDLAQVRRGSCRGR
ncbi:MAG: hypothetical protein ACD_75C00864G0003 [uncultured bacterium]|nr:MAG: hypothetical protein ACD_75C00864G0003 [uncultured bacterium]